MAETVPEQKTNLETNVIFTKNNTENNAKNIE